MIQDVKVPEIGENVESGVVVAVHIKAGDTLAVDDTVIELETDKALVEIPSPFSGRVTEVLAKEGAQMNVGDVIARMETESEEDSPSVDDEAQDADSTAPKKQEETVEAGDRVSDSPDRKSSQESPEKAEAEEKTEAGRESESSKLETDERGQTDAEKAPDRPKVPAAPSVRRLARELGVDIRGISGSGPGGRISETDIKAAVKAALTTDSGKGVQAADVSELPDFSRWGTVETEEMETVRRLTARSTAASWTAIPHVTQFDEADISSITEFIEKNAKKAEQAGAKLTVTAVITRVCAEALKRFPRFNASIDIANHRIIIKRYVHIGIAADTPRGLLVPVVRDADQRSLVDLAKTIGDLAQRARSKKIKPDEMEGGTFTISNQGGIGGVGFTPIVLWPQVAILGVSRSAVKPVYIKDRFEPRTILPLSLSYDHRIIDGADAARFLRWICDGLEQAMTLFLD